MRMPPKEKKRMIGAYISLGILLAFALGVVCWLLAQMVSGVQQIAALMPELNLNANEITSGVLSSVFMMGAVVILIFGSFTFMSVMFFSKDNEFLLGMPIRTGTIFAVKMTVVYLMELFLAVIIYLPVIITIAVASGISGNAVGAQYYILGLLSIVFLPFVPLALVALVSYPLMYVTSFIKKYNGLGGIILIALFVAVMGAYFWFIYGAQLAGAQSGDASGSEMAEGMAGSLAPAGKVFYPGWLYANAMLGVGNFGENFGIFLAILAGLIALAFGFSVLMYKKSMTNSFETYTKKADGKISEGSYKRTSVVAALMKRDLKDIFQNTYLSFQSFSIVVLTPVLIAIMSVIMNGQFSAALTQDVAVDLAAGMGETVAILVAFTMFLSMASGANMLASVAFSREGSNFYILKILPVSEKEIIKSKLYLADIILLVMVFLVSIMVGAVAGAWYDGLFFFALGSVYALSINAFMIKRDLKNPQLNWMTIKEILRNNGKNLVPMFIGLALGVGVLLVVVLAMAAGGLFDPLYLRLMIYLPWLVADIVLFVLFRINVYEKTEGLLSEIEA